LHASTGAPCSGSRPPLKLASGWHRDGPQLPLEFVRQSDDDPELALALHEGAKPVPTYRAWLATGSLRDVERAKAEDYVRHTPAHIDKAYSRLIEARLGWRPLREAYITQRS
jgi:hypothetical protein